MAELLLPAAPANAAARAAPGPSPARARAEPPARAHPAGTHLDPDPYACGPDPYAHEPDGRAQPRVYYRPVDLATLSVPLPTAASLLGLARPRIRQLVALGELECVHQGPHRFIPLPGLFAYRRRMCLVCGSAYDDERAAEHCCPAEGDTSYGQGDTSYGQRGTQR
ncbi:hypothetical protein [Streptomyces sp. CT34]|uniref:hypothetical protein n=1 Tax=Streptomyces sp. CT34 TaxID=1553907 RepID=UPI0005B985D0|nr:hypothetical protein [Streptomyces sp. CT34]